MIRISKIMLWATALSLSSLLPAMAADYDPQVVVNQPDQFVPVEVGTGWYLRGDVDYAFNHSFRNIDFGSPTVTYKERETLFSGSVGFGYHFTDWLRADLNLGYLPGNKVSSTDTGLGASGQVKNNALYGMANVFADLGTYVGFTPYVGAGAGILRSNPEATVNGPGGEFNYHSPNYSFAYTLNAGLSYAVTTNMSLDLGYQYLAAPSAKTVSLDTPDTYSTQKGIHYHQIRLGLRYDLW